MENPKVSNPNDFKVVQFQNKTDFDFTPDMGCMFDGRPISGTSGALGIQAGEVMTLPYHIGHRLATNLAKAVQVRKAPLVDEANNPVGKPLWTDDSIEALKNTFITELYSETKPLQMSETDLLMAKVEEYKKMVDVLINTKAATPPSVEAGVPNTPKPATFSDKQEVIAELEKRGIAHDKRKSKADLETLLK